MTVRTLPPADVEWLQAQCRQARRAAAHARGGRRDGRDPLDLHHTSATARLCAFGETMQHFGVSIPTAAADPVTTDKEI